MKYGKQGFFFVWAFSFIVSIHFIHPPIVSGHSPSKSSVKSRVSKSRSLPSSKISKSKKTPKSHTKPTHRKKTSSKKRQVKKSPVQIYKAAIVMDANTGRILFKENSHEKLLPASLTKMMVTLVAMEKIKEGVIHFEDKIRISKHASQVGGSQIYLRRGETLTLQDLLKATLIKSANDAAVAVAEHISGSQEKFVQLMNTRARELGMVDTLFINVHGLPSGNGQDNISSAYDMAILARELIKYPQTLEWSSKPVAQIRRSNKPYKIANTNKLLRSFQGLDGLKTGYYDKAGFNLAATAERDNQRLIAVTMGSPSSQDRFNAVKKLLSKGFNQYQKKEITIPKKSFSKSVKGVVNTKSGRLNVRKGAGKEFKVIDKLEKGEAVKVLESSGEWYKLKLSGGRTGYVAARYIKIRQKILSSLMEKEEPSSKVSTSKKPLNKPAKGIVNTKSGRLNVRKGAGTNFKIIDKLEKGETVKILESSGGWYKLKLSDGRIGYVAAQYIKSQENISSSDVKEYKLYPNIAIYINLH